MYTAPQSPRTIGGVMDDAIDLFASSFRSIWLLTVLYTVVAGGLAVYLQLALLPGSLAGGTPAARTAQMFAAYGSPRVALTYLATLVVSGWFTLALVSAQLQVARGSTSVNGLAQLGAVLPQLPGALLGTLLMGIAIVCGLVALLVPGLFLLVRWTVTTPALVDRRKGIFDAMGTSWQYVRGNWWRTCIILTLALTIAFVVATTVGMVFGFVAARSHLDRASLLIGTQIASALTQLLYWPAMVSAVVSTYLDLRLRREGDDIEARLQALGAPA